jgi:hypothetical protein
MNGGLFAAIFLVMHFAIAKNDRATVLGWICTFISICVYMAPLSTVVSELNIVKKSFIFLTIIIVSHLIEKLLLHSPIYFH